jgi:hypothetical protein
MAPRVLQQQQHRDRGPTDKQKEEEVVKLQQQGLEEGDVVMGEATDGEGGSIEEVRAGTKCSRCAKFGSQLNVPFFMDIIIILMS